MLDHDPSASAAWTVADGIASLRVSPLPREGGRLHANYGPKGNGELLVGYGFCLERNPDDVFSVRFADDDAREARWRRWCASGDARDDDEEEALEAYGLRRAARGDESRRSWTLRWGSDGVSAAPPPPGLLREMALREDADDAPARLAELMRARRSLIEARQVDRP